MWDKDFIDFGEIAEGIQVSAEFVYTPDKQILEISQSCNCTKFEFEDNKLKVWWSIGVKKKNRKVMTYLSVEYTDSTVDDLKLEAKVKI